MSTYTIGEVAERSGFTTSALRYYEGIGLVTPSARTAAGYRLYDDRGLDRLAFIARAKHLGCSLDEITDLVDIWDGQVCGPVQRHFHDLVSAKIDDAQRQVVDLVHFTAQLQAAAQQLSGPPVDGPCGEGCACVTEPEPWASVPLTAKPTTTTIACTLDAAAMPDRIDAWTSVLSAASSHEPTADGGLRIEFGEGVAVDHLATLAEAEHECCPFFAFAITVDHRGVALEVRAPEDAHELLTALFGAGVSTSY